MVDRRRYHDLPEPREHYQSAVASSEVQNTDAIFKNGHNPDVGTSFEIISHDGGTYPFPTEDTTMTISSTDANDTVAGTGARAVLVQGLNSNYQEIQEVVALNGTTAVTLANQYFRINDFIVLTAGTGKTNAGEIYVGYGTVTAGVPANTMESCHAGQARGETALYTVPSGKCFVINKLFVGVDKGKTASIRIKRILNGVEAVELEIQADEGLSQLESDYLVIACEGTDVWVEGKTTTGTTTTIQTISIGLLRKVS